MTCTIVIQQISFFVSKGYWIVLLTCIANMPYTFLYKFTFVINIDKLLDIIKTK